MFRAFQWLLEVFWGGALKRTRPGLFLVLLKGVVPLKVYRRSTYPQTRVLEQGELMNCEVDSQQPPPPPKHESWARRSGFNDLIIYVGQCLFSCSSASSLRDHVSETFASIRSNGLDLMTLHFWWCVLILAHFATCYHSEIRSLEFPSRL